MLDDKIPLVMENSVVKIKVHEDIPSREAINKQEGERIDISGDDVMNTTTNMNLLYVS